MSGSILGPQWFIEIFLSIKAIFSFSGEDRDNMGRAFALPSVAHVTANTTILAVVVLGPYSMYYLKETLNAMLAIVLIFATIILGLVTGSMLGLLRGLPIVPKMVLTTWPKDGYMFVHDRNSKPSYFCSTLLSGGMNSCELYMINVSEIGLFRALISGTVGANILLSKNNESDEYHE